MKLLKLIEQSVVYDLVRDMYIGLSKVLHINVGFLLLVLFIISLSCNMYITSFVLVVNPLTFYHIYNLLKRV